MPIVRTAAGRLCLQLDTSVSADGVLDTLHDAFDAVPGERSPAGHDAWQEYLIEGRRFTVEWSRWRGCRVISDDPAGNATLRRIAVWYQDDREAW